MTLISGFRGGWALDRAKAKVGNPIKALMTMLVLWIFLFLFRNNFYAIVISSIKFPNSIDENIPSF